MRVLEQCCSVEVRDAGDSLRIPIRMPPTRTRWQRTTNVHPVPKSRVRSFVLRPTLPQRQHHKSSGNVTPAATSAQCRNPYPSRRRAPKRKREIKFKSPRRSKTQT
ncbi:hypothetical protein B0H11DRAFT_2236865 [Mycena galericulata]|nr:hypothetical protein B0H11DRAFT_2236865 [Mycena galericulata]